ncbi:VOC family protein [Aquidulcibacter sp.]|uniref:VOC family protein n=1 Tax=Aquidulcibacter sp. TaxID=2052990 RepID=UPI0037C00AE0
MDRQLRFRFAALWVVLSAIIAVPALAQHAPPPQAVEAPYAGSYYKRQLYVVTDMERALTLWRDVIGFQPGAITTSGPNSYSREVFNIPTEAQMRFCTLSAGPTQVRTLALLEVKGVPLAPKSGIRTTGAVINANGRLAEIISRAKAMGLTVFGARVLASVGQGDGTEQGFLDWDGNVIVLYEYPKSDPPSVR